jgi:YmgG-like glycine-zipper protein
VRHKAFVRYFLLVTALLIGCGKSATSPDSNATPSGSPGGAPTAPFDTNSSTAQGAAAPQAPESSLTSVFKPKPIVIKAGTSIVVTADESVSSKSNNSGDHFDASLAEPVVVGDRVVIPKGAKAIGTVTDAKSAGRFKGNAAITVTLASVRVNGEEYKLRTSEVTEAGKGRGKRTAEGAGGGAVVGALIGALAGGGKGAAIGAGAGAGAGTAGTAMTGNRDITIGAETRLHFKLEEPLEVRKN